MAESFSARARTLLFAKGDFSFRKTKRPPTYTEVEGQYSVRTTKHLSYQRLCRRLVFPAFELRVLEHRRSSAIRLNEVYVSELASASVVCWSKLTPGPSVEAMLSVRMYWPLAPVGFARTTASTSAPRFCRILSSS